jgi:predicted SprT family Zn-dependent metalloprotease
MRLFDAEILAKTLISEFAPAGWQLGWMNEKTVNGRCYYNVRTIKLSRHLTPLRTPENVRLTIMHEICHARVGPGKGHGPVWQAEMRKFGLPTDRCSQDQVDKSSISNWSAQCGTCGKMFYMIRQPRQSKACSKCCGGRWNKKYQLTWRGPGGKVFT